MEVSRKRIKIPNAIIQIFFQNGQFVHRSTKLCLDLVSTDSKNKKISLKECDVKSRSQKWSFEALNWRERS